MLKSKMQFECLTVLEHNKPDFIAINISPNIHQK